MKDCYLGRLRYIGFCVGFSTYQRPYIMYRGGTRLSTGPNRPQRLLVWGSWSPNSTRRHVHFLKLTCDMEPSDMRKKTNRHNIGWFLKSTCDMGLFLNRQEIYKNSDKGHGHFLKSTCDIGDPPSRAPSLVCDRKHRDLFIIMFMDDTPPPISYSLYHSPKCPIAFPYWVYIS